VHAVEVADGHDRAVDAPLGLDVVDPAPHAHRLPPCPGTARQPRAEP
jgi:hypothetical protein